MARWRVDLELPQRVDPARGHTTLNLGVLVLMVPISDSTQGEHTLAVERMHAP